MCFVECESQWASQVQLASLYAGGVGTLDPSEIVAAASTAEADALAAAWEYSWLPGQGMQLAMAAIHDMTGFPWCVCGVWQPRHASICHAPSTSRNMCDDLLWCCESGDTLSCLERRWLTIAATTVVIRFTIFPLQVWGMHNTRKLSVRTIIALPVLHLTGPTPVSRRCEERGSACRSQSLMWRRQRSGIVKSARCGWPCCSEPAIATPLLHACAVMSHDAYPAHKWLSVNAVASVLLPCGGSAG